jgi:hypothetical protein
LFYLPARPKLIKLFSPHLVQPIDLTGITELFQLAQDVPVFADGRVLKPLAFAMREKGGGGFTDRLIDIAVRLVQCGGSLLRTSQITGFERAA